MRKLISNLAAVRRRATADLSAAARGAKAERGMSLVEATIILMTLATLTAVLAPSIGDYLNDAKDVKAKEDVEAIGTAIARVTRDTGLPCLSTNGADCKLADRVDLLISGTGTTPSTANRPAVLATGIAFTGSVGTTTTDATPSWIATTGTEATQRATMLDQFATNSTANYPVVTSTGYSSSGPQAGLGWRGAYLSSPILFDPWGHVYEANTLFLAVASDATAGSSEGNQSGGWQHDVIVLSAGRNGVIETPFGGSTNNGSGLTGDDLAYTVSGSTR